MWSGTDESENEFSVKLSLSLRNTTAVFSLCPLFCCPGSVWTSHVASTAARGAVGKFKISTPLDCLAKSVLSHAPPHISTYPGRKRVIEKTGKFSSLAFPRRGLTKRLVYLLVCWTQTNLKFGSSGC